MKENLQELHEVLQKHLHFFGGHGMIVSAEPAAPRVPGQAGCEG